MNYKKRTGATTSQNISIDDVAVLAKKIGEEIWGKNTFTAMMSSTTQTKDTDPIKGFFSCNPYVKTNKRQESA